MGDDGPPPPPARGRRASLFEVGKRIAPVGSSIMAHICEPVPESEMVLNIRQPKIQYENTYRMEPEGKFPPGKVEAIMREVLDENLAEKTYDPLGCSILSKVMAQEIKGQVEELDLKRYKLVSIVNIGEKKDQGVRIGSRCVWDATRDNFAMVNFENPHLFATAAIYAVYYE